MVVNKAVNKEQTDSNQQGAGKGIAGERRGRVTLRNMYKEPKDKDQWGARGQRFESEGWVGQGSVIGEKRGEL